VPFVKAALLSSLPEGGALGVEVSGVRVALAKVGDDVYAIADNCSHRDFPLSHGEVDAEACTLTCEWHGAAFDLRTGAPTCPPAVRPVAVFPAKVDGGAVWVDVGDEAGPPAPRLGGILGF
jgi:3-phenylpropionate/trans-cinnamate dioxygenase ferredoxin subunit